MWSKPILRHRWGIALAVVLLLVAAAMSVRFGARPVNMDAVIAGVGGDTQSIESAAVYRRVMRTVLAALAGAALGVSGLILQSLTRNPLADPGIFGTNAGASLFVVIGLAYFGIESAQSFIWLGILGAAIATVLVMVIGSLGFEGPTPLKLALAGAATSIALTAITIAIVLPRVNIAESVRAWHVGGVGGATWEGILHVLPFLSFGFIAAWVFARALDDLSLGDEVAQSLGQNVVLMRGICAVAAVCLAGSTTAICGPIGFVGLAVPHLCRIFLRQNHRMLIPAAALTGAGFVIIADVIGRVVARPTEMQVGIVVAFVGAPLFIWIVRRRSIPQL